MLYSCVISHLGWLYKCELAHIGWLCCVVKDHTLGGYINVWLLFIGGRDHWRDVVFSPYAEENFRQWFRLVLVRTAALKKFCSKPDQHIVFADYQIQQGRKTERGMSRTAPRSCVDTQSHR